jgi:tryptophanyl-tRNA synthetase
VKARVVSGMRPTGLLHLGHLVGALSNWVPMQDHYDCFYFVADWHAVTSEYADTNAIVSNTYDMVADWISAGLDPEKSTFFVQSLVPEHAELFLLLSMVVPVPWLERVPTYTEQQDNLKDRDLSTLGFLGYPLLQTADVAMYDAKLVPVGADQVAHLELSRENRPGASTISSATCSSSRSRCSTAVSRLPASTRQEDEQEHRQHDSPHRTMPTRS